MLILKGNRSYRISTDVTERPDVASYFKLSSLFSGFDVLLPVTSVAKGKTGLYVCSVNPEQRSDVTAYLGAAVKFLDLYTLKE